MKSADASKGADPPGRGKGRPRKDGNPSADPKLRIQQAADPLATNSSPLPSAQGGGTAR
jgi:hypothetical protein